MSCNYPVHGAAVCGRSPIVREIDLPAFGSKLRLCARCSDAVAASQAEWRRLWLKKWPAVAEYLEGQKK